MNSKLGNLTRKRPEFEPGEAGAEAAQLKQVERCKRVSNSEAADEVKNQVLNSFRYIHSSLLANGSPLARHSARTCTTEKRPVPKIDRLSGFNWSKFAKVFDSGCIKKDEKAIAELKNIIDRLFWKGISI